MRFISNPPILGDSRVVTWFALLPVTIETPRHVETRWLERVTVVQRYFENDFVWGPTWGNVRFVDDKENTCQK